MVNPPTLRFTDARVREDLATYVARARSLDDDGAIRLQSSGMALAAYVGVLPGRGLMGEGAVIGLRVMPLAEPVADLDVVVSLRSVVDRLARREADPSRVAVPPTTVRAGWAALAPPRSGWEPVGTLDPASLNTAAAEGIAEITRGAPEGSGSHAVSALRQAVWGRPTPTVPPVPSGAAFAAYALGFLTGEDARVLANGRWTRLSTSVGHVLVR